jgi:hypothetical protein
VEQKNLALADRFFKNRAIELHSLKWATNEDVWVVAKGRFASIEEMGDKFILSLEEELVYRRIAAKLEEMSGNQSIKVMGQPWRHWEVDWIV